MICTHAEFESAFILATFVTESLGDARVPTRPTRRSDFIEKAAAPASWDPDAAPKAPTYTLKPGLNVVTLRQTGGGQPVPLYESAMLDDLGEPEAVVFLHYTGHIEKWKPSASK